MDKKLENWMAAGSIVILLCILAIDKWPAVMMGLALIIGLAGVYFLVAQLNSADDSKGSSQWMKKETIS